MDSEIFKVFILEDQQLDLELNKRQVRKFRPDVLFAVARNRTEFREKLVDFQPDIVLSDYNLPDMNGLDGRKSNQTLLAKSIAELREADFNGKDSVLAALQQVADNLR